MALNDLDVPYRYERKFKIIDVSFKKIEHLIKFNPWIFSEIFYVRRVNNLYLDSIELENYQDNVAGVSKRIKIRIRWYGDIFGFVKKPVLELKIKNNELGTKKTYPLKSFYVNKNLSKENLTKVFENSDIPESLKEKLKLYNLSLLNSYVRKYFQSANKKHRITLDFNQVFFNISNKNNKFNEQIKDNESCIMEIKSGLNDYLEANEVGQHFPFRLVANSKYCFGIRNLKN